MEGAQDPDPVEDLRTGEYLAQWLSHARGRVRGKTYEGYEGVIRLYATPSVGDIPLGDLHPLHLQRLYGELLDRGLSGGPCSTFTWCFARPSLRPCGGGSSPTARRRGPSLPGPAAPSPR
jgi:hypothetical protein